MSNEELLGALLAGGDREAVRFAADALTYGELAGAAASVAERLAGIGRAAAWATASLHTVVAVAGALAAGTELVPLNPGAGSLELEHIVRDSAPQAVLAAAGVALPESVGQLARIEVDPWASGGELRPASPDPERTAIILYTSGTTGPPKGVQIPVRAIASNLSALAAAWEWSGVDRLVHGLPLFHAHGLVLGVLGPLRLGGGLEHVVKFSPHAIAEALGRGATMLFGVPTMYHRLAEEAERDGRVAQALSGARILVSGSAALPATVHRRIEELCGQRVVERYGMTETLMITAIRARGERAPGYVGPPLDGVEVRLLDDDRKVLEVSDDETIGEIAVSGPNLFTGYLNRPDATAEAIHDGWFLTGDLATRAPDGYLRLVGRRSTDIIKSGGYKIGAGEVETALLEHRAIAEVAVTGEPDPDLGERIVAWVVLRPGTQASAEELIDHARRLLSSHKRPRVVRFVDELPRNAMGKVLKRQLGR
jgi:malonyl-CoA/methylmalonyl-CoA synthetase